MAKPTRKRVRTAVPARPRIYTHRHLPVSRRYTYTPELLAEGRRRYERTEDRIVDIAADFGIHKTTFQRMANENGWLRYKAQPRDLSRSAKLAAKAEALEASFSLPPRSGGEGGSGARERDGVGWGACAESKAPPTPNPSPPFETRMGGGEENAAPPTATPAQDKPWNMRERIEELRHAVDEELAAVRALRAKMKSVPHATEKASRTSRTLADLTTTLERLHRLEIGAPQHDGQNPYDDDIPADIDAFRDALARKIEAFMESRTDAECGLGDDAAGGDAPRP